LVTRHQRALRVTLMRVEQSRCEAVTGRQATFIVPCLLTCHARAAPRCVSRSLKGVIEELVKRPDDCVPVVSTVSRQQATADERVNFGFAQLNS
jgi:hypothetical protein